MNFKKWVKSIQIAGYNGARTLSEIDFFSDQLGFRSCLIRTKILKIDFMYFFDRSRNQLMDIKDSFLFTYFYCSLKGLSRNRPFAVHFVFVIS